MLWWNSHQNFQVYSLKNLCGHLALLGKLYLLQNLFIQGKVGVANGKVGVRCDGRRLILKTLSWQNSLFLDGLLLKKTLLLSYKSTTNLSITGRDFIEELDRLTNTSVSSGYEFWACILHTNYPSSTSSDAISWTGKYMKCFQTPKATCNLLT